MADRKDMDRATPPPPNEGTPHDATNRGTERLHDDAPAKDLNDDSAMDAIQRRLKFGSAGGGGAELEPGIPRQDADDKR